MDETPMEEDLIDIISDVSTDSIHESPTTKNLPKIQFSKHPKNVREYAAKIRKIERKIMLGLLTDIEETKLRGSKYFSKRFEKLLNLSNTTSKGNLYKIVTGIALNKKMTSELQKKIDSKAGSHIMRRKLQTKIHNLQVREKAVQEKVKASSLSQNDVDSFLRDQYFTVMFGDKLTLDHPPAYQGDELGTNPQPSDGMLCDYCQSSNEKNRFGQREDLLVCKDCSNKAHPSCLNYSKELVEQIRSDGSWQCIDCKACFICNGTGDPDTLLFCDACDKGYHMQCHTPKLEQTPSGKWACATCISKGKSVSTATNSKQVLVIDEEKEKVDEKENKPIPMAIVVESPLSPQQTPMTPTNDVATTAVAVVPTNTVHPQRAVEKPPTVHMSPVNLPINSPPVISVKSSNIVYQGPNGVTYAQLPIHSTPSSIPPGHAMPIQSMQFPMNQQHHLIPVNYMIPNGAHAMPPHMTQLPQLPPQQPPSQVVLGKGMHNELTHILNPKVPLPDVRSSIREDVLRALPPDVADWSVQNVVYYFKAHGYIQESNLLEEQEIDGRAMLLMSRNDCLTGLRIKLGPALKIYHMHIHKLQKRTDFLG